MRKIHNINNSQQYVIIPSQSIENFEKSLAQKLLMSHTPVTLNQSQGQLD